ncbi:hypothetical protein EMPG_11029, partial [Blastomyces silverae]
SNIMIIEIICEICYYQKSVKLILFKIIFIYLIYEISERNYQFQCSTLNTIQLTAEFTLITLFKYNIKIITHYSCVILTVRNIHLIMNIIESLRSKFF